MGKSKAQERVEGHQLTDGLTATLDSFAWGWFKVRRKKRRTEVQFKACIKEDEAERETGKK